MTQRLTDMGIMARRPEHPVVRDSTARRDGWPRGPWDDEADEYEWRHFGFPCLIIRNVLGALCGYVAVAEGHPWFGKDADDIDASAHGGICYTDVCARNICHIPRAGEPARVWWVGFDCAHYNDLCPALGCAFDYQTYKPISYVVREVRNLAKQAHVAVHPRARPRPRTPAGITAPGA